jgi:hypothetical protein
MASSNVPPPESAEADSLPLGPAHSVPVRQPQGAPGSSVLKRWWKSIFGATPFDRPPHGAPGTHQFFGGLMQDGGSRRPGPKNPEPPQA